MTALRSFRLPVDVDEALARAAELRGVTKTAVLSEALRSHLASGERSEAGERAATSPEAITSVPVQAAPQASVDLAVWLAGRTGLPRAVCRAKIRRGSVLVGGRAAWECEAPEALAAGVELDGEPV